MSNAIASPEQGVNSNMLTRNAIVQVLMRERLAKVSRSLFLTDKHVDLQTWSERLFAIITSDVWNIRFMTLEVNYGDIPKAIACEDDDLPSLWSNNFYSRPAKREEN